MTVGPATPFKKEDDIWLLEMFKKNPSQFLQFHYMNDALFSCQVYTKNLSDQDKRRLKEIKRSVHTNRMLVI